MASTYRVTTDQGVFDVTVDDGAATPPPASATIGMLQPSTLSGAGPAGEPRQDPIPGWLSQMDTRSGELRQNAVEHPIATAANIAITAAGPEMVGALPKVPGILARRLGISTARAGQNIQAALSGAAETPIDLTAVTPALEQAQAKAAYLGSRKAINTLVKRVADQGTPILAPEGQQAASALSALAQTAKPAMRRPIMELAQALRGATGEATDQAATYNLGVEAMPGQYQRGIAEYRRAMLAKSLAKKAAGAAAAAGALNWLRRTQLGQAAEGLLK